jgi:hypothetical protein
MPTSIDWANFQTEPEDLEFISAYLLEQETPLGPEELAVQLIANRLSRPEAEPAGRSGEKMYLPKERYAAGDQLFFPALKNAGGQVSQVRNAGTINGNNFDVIDVQMQDGSRREFAAGLVEHVLNNPPKKEDKPKIDAAAVAKQHAKQIVPKIVAALKASPDFVYIAGRWFPKALIVDVNAGQMNVAEAFLDMAAGGPLPTSQLLGEVELPTGVNPKLAEFSLDLALQGDQRFDEVGPAGEVAWFLRRLEPEAVREVPLYLRYDEQDYDRAALGEDMLDLESRLDDELTPWEAQEDVEPKLLDVPLLYPHWRAGTLPLTLKMGHLFPTALESPRVRFEFVDAQDGTRFQGWVVRPARYIYGLREWYVTRGLMPGSLVRVRRGEKAGEVLVSVEAHRASKEWVRTALMGADGGVVYATLKQQVNGAFDERMMLHLPGELTALDAAWQRRAGRSANLENVVSDALRDLAKLNPQGHVHATELYSAVNLTLRCPPGPILALLASSPRIQHVGHLHFRLAEGA